MSLEIIGKQAKAASRELAQADSASKQQALHAMAASLTTSAQSILQANVEDLQAAEAAGMSPSMMDRLRLTTERIQGMSQGILDVAALADPIGEVLEGYTRPNGLRICKKRVPIGVIGIIYEARPNVTADAAALCLKAGSAAILRGGKEAIASNKAITRALREGLQQAGMNFDLVQLVEDTSRESATAMMRLHGYIDVLIPRGGAGLIRAVVENATVPVIETGTGNCHIYVDAAADTAMARAIAVNAKTSRPSVCNAAETLLVHRDIAATVLPEIAHGMAEKQVELRCCPVAQQILTAAAYPHLRAADEADWDTEFLDYIMAVRVVDSLEQAVEHITRYGTGHSECIVTGDLVAAGRFTDLVDAAAVYVNASTRFTDGGEFGMGAEIGISTQKLHARGPMGLREMTTFKYVIQGEGQIR